MRRSRFTREQEAALFATGDRAAIVAQYLPYVESIARRFAHGKGQRFDDLMQEGSIGLLDAIERFDIARGNRFTTYATHWINHHIRRYLNRTARIVIVGRSGEHSVAMTGIRLGTITDPESLSRVAKVSIHVAESLFPVLARPALSDRQGSDGDEWLSTERTPEADLIEADWLAFLRVRIALALARLDDRERLVIERRYLGEERDDLESIGRDFGISRQRIQQIESVALKKLRASLKSTSTHLAA